MTADGPTRGPKERPARPYPRPLWLGLVLLLALVPATRAVAQNGGVIENGTYVEFDDDGIVVDPILGHLGYVAFGTFDDCPCEYGHYHGILFGEDDPDPDGCGHGCIVPTDVALETLLGRLDKLSRRATKNKSLRKKFKSAATLLGNTAADGCFAIADGVLDGVNAMIAGADDTGLIKKRKRRNALIAGWGRAGLLAAAKAPPPPPRLPAAPAACQVDLYAQMSGGSWGAPVGDSEITYPRLASVQLRAEGKPAGGSYSWSYDYSVPDLAAGVQAANTFFQGQGPLARWMSVSTRTVVVTVTYKCPPGANPATVTDTITLRVR